MSTTSPKDAFDQLNRDLGFQPLSHWWGRGEMLIGLLVMAAGLFGMFFSATEAMRQITTDIRETAVTAKDTFAFPYAEMIGSAMAFALGGYLALAGHRRHLYESNDRLTAYLACLIRNGGVVPDQSPEPAAPPAPAPAPPGGPAPA